ncbi:MAG: baseplate J/gp47 family protein [Anaerolineaceae bacterium]|nr:baseplate J/gp47 family protein [Anaerolineaceae bacterium]
MSEKATYVIYIKTSDQREKFLAEIARADSRRVLLVFPARGKAGLSELDLRIIQRFCVRNYIELAISTRRRGVRMIADDLNIPVFKTVNRARHQHWMIRDHRKGHGAPDQLERGPVGERLEQIQTAQPRSFRQRYVWARQFRWWHWACVGAAAVAVGLLWLFLSPSATVYIPLKAETQSMQMALSASPKVLAADISGRMPLHEQYLILEKDGHAPSSGSIFVPDDYATGTVDLQNLTDAVQVVDAGLVVMTQRDPVVQFWTTESVRLPAGVGETVSVQVVALEPGRIGNVEAGSIRAIAGQMGALISVRNELPTYGGYDYQTPSVSEEDVAALREYLLAALREEAEAAFEDQLSAGDRLVPASLRVEEIIHEEVLPNVGEPADSFQLSLRVRYRVDYVSLDDLTGVAAQLLDLNLPEGWSADADSLELVPLMDVKQTAGGAEWNVFAARKMVQTVDADDLAQYAGMPVGQFVSWITEAYELRSKPRVETRPKWWKRLPYLGSRLEFVSQ